MWVVHIAVNHLEQAEACMKVGGISSGGTWLDSGSEAVSAYLIRSRPSGRKINIWACCYCRARGRAVTRAQHNIYTAGLTHIHTLTLGSTYTCTHSEGSRKLERHTFCCTNNRHFLLIAVLCLYTHLWISVYSLHIQIYTCVAIHPGWEKVQEHPVSVWKYFRDSVYFF